MHISSFKRSTTTARELAIVFVAACLQFASDLDLSAAPSNTMPDHSTSFLSFVDAKHEVLKCNIRIGTDAAVIESLSEKSSEAIKAQLANMPKLQQLHR